MNALQRIVSTAGQKVHERFYEAKWTWAGKELDCTHGDIVRNPPLMQGGFSPDTEVVVTVRNELFGDPKQRRPQKSDLCLLRIDDENQTVFALQVTTVMTSTGAVIQKFLCHDANQSA